MTIEHGGRKGYMEQIVDYLDHFGFKVHRVNQWDVELEKDPTKPIRTPKAESDSFFSKLWNKLTGKA
jgi:hypothetical protein